jgi:hypothetical protein
MPASDRPINPAYAEDRLCRGEVHALDPETQEQHGYKRGQRDQPDQRRAGDLLVEAAGDGDGGDKPGQAEADRHVVVDRQHVAAQPGIDGGPAKPSFARRTAGIGVDIHGISSQDIRDGREAEHGRPIQCGRRRSIQIRSASVARRTGRKSSASSTRPQRQHPRPQDRKDAEDAADDQQQARRHAQPPRGGLPKPVNRVPETSRQTPDQQFQPAFPIIFLILPRSSGQCRAGRVSLCVDTQKSGSFLHEPRRTSDAETVEKWGF